MQGEGLIHVHIGGQVPGTQGLGIGHGQLSAHVQVLTALSWEEERGLTLLLAQAIVNPLGGGEGLALALNQLSGLAKLGGQICQIRSNNAHPMSASIEAELAILGKERQQALAPVHLGRNLNSLERTHQCIRAVSPHHKELVRCDPVTGGLNGSRVLFNSDVEVGATKTKAGHTSTTGVVASPNPGTGPHVQVEGGLLQVHLGVGPLHLDGRRQHFVMQGHDGLEESSCAGGRLGMANLGLHATQSTVLSW